MRPIIILFLSGFVQASQAGEFVPADGPPIKDRYIVALRNGMPPQAREGLLRILAGNPDVAYVEQDATVWASASQLPAVRGLDHIDQSRLHLNNLLYSVLH